MSFTTPGHDPNEEYPSAFGWGRPADEPTVSIPATGERPADNQWSSATTEAWSTGPPSWVADGPSDPDQFHEESLPTPAGPPVVWLAISAVAVVTAAVLVVVFGSATAGLIGWILAGPVAISLLAVFGLRDGAVRATGWYRPSDVAEWGRRAIAVACLLVVVLSAYQVADDVARGMWS